MHTRLPKFVVCSFVTALCVLMLMSSSPVSVFSQSQEGWKYFLSDEGEQGEKDLKRFDDCGQFWPSAGRFETYTDGYEYSATLHFRLTQSEKTALQCVDQYLELDFALVGFNPPRGLVYGWEEYSIDTNIPGGVHDSAEGDATVISGDLSINPNPGNTVTPAVTGIKISDLDVGTDYYAGIHFTGLPIDDKDPSPRVAFEWQVSHWANLLNPYEATCPLPQDVLGANNFAKDCVFATTHVYLSNGYTANEYGPDSQGRGQALPFDGIRFWEFPGTASMQPPAESNQPPIQPADQAPVSQESTQTESPRSAPQQTSFFLPWEVGSVWQVTQGNEAGSHADQYNKYAFDAVPVEGQSTSNVTAIGDGTVLGFQSDIPNSARFNQGHAGNCMLIQHQDGSISIYAHLAEGSIPGDLRHDGAAVRSGMVIGSVGDTGYADGVHLHWSLLSDGFMYDSEGYRTCAGTSIPSRYADNDAELIEDGGVPRTGRSYASTNGSASAVQEQPAPQVSSPNEPSDSSAGEGAEAPPSDNPATCDESAVPDVPVVGSDANVTDDGIQVTFRYEMVFSGCAEYSLDVRVVHYGPDGSKDVLRSETFEIYPGWSWEDEFAFEIQGAGDHYIKVEGNDGSGWQVLPSEGYSEAAWAHIWGGEEDTDVGGSSRAGGEKIDLSQFTAMCHYYWSSDEGDWVELDCNYQGSDDFGEMLYEPRKDGCVYLFDGTYFYEHFSYGCYSATGDPGIALGSPDVSRRSGLSNTLTSRAGFLVPPQINKTTLV